ncbi:MAG: YgjV family protein, partial [Propionibacteriaceae bacterium]|nr:YgjV family protein [Propionibacteriaceae bacterium]
MSAVTIEIIGYVASILIVASLAMTSVLRLRTLSLLGSIAYVVYGVLLSAWPIVVANAVIAALNIWNIYRELTSKKELGVSPIAVDAPYLADFLQAHQDDIDKFQPGVRPEDGDH